MKLYEPDDKPVIINDPTVVTPEDREAFKERFFADRTWPRDLVERIGERAIAARVEQRNAMLAGDPERARAAGELAGAWFKSYDTAIDLCAATNGILQSLAGGGA